MPHSAGGGSQGPGPDLSVAAAWFEPSFFDAPDLPVTLAAVLPNATAMAFDGFPAAARPSAGRIASGAGLSAAEALRRALGEAVELCACCGWGETGLPDRELPEGAELLDAATLLGFSEAQMAQRTAWNTRWGAFDHWPDIPCMGPTAWLKGFNVASGIAAWAPADLVLIGGISGCAASSLGSAGCASAPSLNAAIEAALLELVERDAVGEWWWGRGRLTRVSLELLEPWSELALAVHTRPRVTRLAALEAYAGLPCVVAMSHDAEGEAVALGFAARRDWPEAALAATLEMVGVEFRLRAFRAGPFWQGAAGSPLQTWLSCINVRDARFQARVGPLSTLSTKVTDPLARCRVAGLRLIVFNMTRSALKAPAVRLIAPTLRSERPRFRGRPAQDVWLESLLAHGKARGGRAAVPLLV